jgi:ABC-type multidrug transport system ATPase subunit
LVTGPQSLQALGLSKSFPEDGLLASLRGRKRLIFSGLSLVLAPGDFVCLHGPNGVGKSTFLRVLAGFLGPDRGRIQLGSEDLTPRGILRRRQVTLVSGEERSFYWRLTCRENLRFFTTIARPDLSRGAVGALVDEEIDRLGLTPFAGQRFGRLSSGFIQRAALARGFMAGRRFLLLDEADRQLDPEARAMLLRRVSGLCLAGGAALWVTHRPEDLQGHSTRSLVLSSGGLEDLEGGVPCGR